MAVCGMCAVTTDFILKEDNHMAEHNDLGHWGEMMAAEYLERGGFRILHRNWRDGHRDLDIVAIDADQLVIVEVKTRKTDAIMAPELAVDRRKMRNLGIAAMKYVSFYGIEMPLRFDIVTVTGTVGGECSINHIENAFNPMNS